MGLLERIGNFESTMLDWAFSGYRFVGDRFVLGQGGALLR
jgi:hypothetical protein